MKFTSSLKRNNDFKRLYSKGKSVASGYAVVFYRRNGRKENRLGITVSTKLGGAVQRNRIRRRLKEIYRLNESKLATGHDIVIVARGASCSAGFKQLESSLMSLFARLHLMENAQ